MASDVALEYPNVGANLGTLIYGTGLGEFNHNRKLS